MNAHNILTILYATIKAGAYDVNYLTLAPVALQSRMGDFQPTFLAWLLQRYAELGMMDASMLQAAEAMRVKHPDAFCQRDPNERFPNGFMVQTPKHPSVAFG